MSVARVVSEARSLTLTSKLRPVAGWTDLGLGYVILNAWGLLPCGNAEGCMDGIVGGQCRLGDEGADAAMSIRAAICFLRRLTSSVSGRIKEGSAMKSFS